MTDEFLTQETDTDEENSSGEEAEKTEASNTSEVVEESETAEPEQERETNVRYSEFFEHGEEEIITPLEEASDIPLEAEEVNLTKKTKSKSKPKIKEKSNNLAITDRLKAAFRYIKNNKSGFDFSDFFKRVLLSFPELTERIGERTIKVLLMFFKAVKPIFVVPVFFILSLFKNAVLSLKAFTVSMSQTFADDFAKMRYERKLIRKRISKSDKRLSLYFKTMRKYFFISLSKHSIFWKTIFNTVFPFIAIALLVVFLNSSNNKCTALEVFYEGKNLGFVENEAVFESGKSLANSLIPLTVTNGQKTKAFGSEPVYKLKRVSPSKLSSDKMICENIIASTDKELVHACGIYIDGEFLCAVKNESDAVSIFESLLAPSKRNASKDKIVAFVEEVNYTQGLYPKESIWDTLKLRSTLKEPKTKAKYYKIKKGDNAKIIARKHSLSVSKLKALNPNTDFLKLTVGKKVLVSAESYYVRVKVMRTKTYTTAIKYETEKRESSYYLKGTTKVAQKGRKGKKITTELVTYINGVETYSTVVSEKVITQPIKEVIYVGTKTVSSYIPPVHNFTKPSYNSGYSGGYTSVTPSYGTGSSTRMIWPTKGAYVLSSRYGYRSASISGWSFHGGVDIIKSGGHSTGIPVVAAASGTVVSAVSGYSGYGHTVVIDHGNGLRTRYAHMQAGSLTVRAGQRVYQGQQLGRIGSTGNVTGPHLHFEVLRNGSKTNPLAYIR